MIRHGLSGNPRERSMVTSGIAEEVVGIAFDEIEEDLAVLTIELRTDVSAEALATLLRGLATFYKVGATLDRWNGDSPPAIVLEDADGNSVTVPASELLISQLTIGTPNKVKVVGIRRWIKDLTAFVRAATLALSTAAPMVPHAGDQPPQPPSQQVVVKQGDQIQRQGNQTQNLYVYPAGQPATPASPEYYMTGPQCMEAFNKLADMRAHVSELFAEGKISWGDYEDQNRALSTAQSDIMDGLKKTGRCFPPKT
jgi:hypothetical protein